MTLVAIGAAMGTNKHGPSAPAKAFFELDFKRDWAEIQCSALKGLGYDTSTITGQELSFSFFNVMRRRIEPVPRRILEAAVLVCPPEHLDGFTSLKGKIERGVDLRLHLSKKIKLLDFDDYLLNDWGIHHLHLGTTLDKSGFVQRTGPVLYARFEKDMAYLLAVMDHGHWANDELVKILHRNWPAFTERYRLRGITPDSLSTAERTKLRAGGLNAVINLDGNAYAGFGGGYSTSGLSTEVVITADYYADRVERAERAVRLGAQEIRDKAAQLGFRLARRVSVTLKVDDDNHFYALLSGTRMAVDLGPIEDWIQPA